MYPVELILKMKEHCTGVIACIDKNDSMCQYRGMCHMYIEGGMSRKTPKHTKVNEMADYYEIVRQKKCKGQKFKNTGYPYMISRHESGQYYTRLKHFYCRKKGFIMCDEWLDYQNFAKWWELNISGKNISPMLKEDIKYIDPNSMIFKKKITRNRKV